MLNIYSPMGGQYIADNMDASKCADLKAVLQVASFQCLQPFVGTLLAFAILGEEPSLWDLGAVGVILGLITVAYDKKDQPNPIINRMRRAFSMKDLAMKGRFSPKRDKREADNLI